MSGKRTVSQLQHALRALKREAVGFTFSFPLQARVHAACAGALEYYIVSDVLFLDDMRFDAQGVVQKVYRAQGPQYNPLFIAWWGLHRLGVFHATGDSDALKDFWVQIEWLRLHALRRQDEAVVWPCAFDWQEGAARLKSPWISAMYQSVVISALVRAYRLKKDSELIDLCLKATKVFSLSIEDGGVRTVMGRGALYEEYPVYPLPRVLDGFLFSLLGLYDLAVETGAPQIHGLFADGVCGLREALGMWDYRGKWSWYGTHGYLCPPHYHQLNACLLELVGTLVGDEELVVRAHRWFPPKRSWLDQAEIYSAFLLTKNLARLRLPRN
ncbi:hypothetical protein COMA1_60059 [Candidatus Nitrospira nitrosa]|uniref:D-glucuronyl C5-epimerase C-terminal domain-containing protein n=1 Tax=Candidatus Nitrospira nitrosa TaxID=1742972 RepID=A0A0S4LNE4_9BACT|nr:D-glucuronyl C5-epimerase family protein [Candidatus Nitrospira nitrosa]CUS38767.1 hypothetical protein COMA1_60059 [Candidatus Nitrospira nitrosa]